MSTEKRRTEIKRLREEGRRAAFDGVNIQANPHRDMDAFQWEQGWVSGEQDRIENLKVSNVKLTGCADSEGVTKK